MSLGTLWCLPTFFGFGVCQGKFFAASSAHPETPQKLSEYGLLVHSIREHAAQIITIIRFWPFYKGPESFFP